MREEQMYTVLLSMNVRKQAYTTFKLEGDRPKTLVEIKNRKARVEMLKLFLRCG